MSCRVPGSPGGTGRGDRRQARCGGGTAGRRRRSGAGGAGRDRYAAEAGAAENEQERNAAHRWQAGKAYQPDQETRALLDRARAEDTPAAATAGREAALRLWRTAGPNVITAAAQALSGDDDAVTAFVRTGLEEAIERDDRTSARIVGGASLRPAERQAAKTAAEGSHDEVKAYLATRAYPGRDDDDRIAVQQLVSAGGPELRAAANAALSGPWSYVQDFLKVGQYKAANRDFEAAYHVATVSGYLSAAAQAAATARNAADEANRWAAEAVASADRARSAATAQRYADAASQSAARASASASQAAWSAAQARTAAEQARLDAEAVGKSFVEALQAQVDADNAVLAKQSQEQTRQAAADTRDSVATLRDAVNEALEQDNLPDDLRQELERYRDRVVELLSLIDQMAAGTLEFVQQHAGELVALLSDVLQIGAGLGVAAAGVAAIAGGLELCAATVGGGAAAGAAIGAPAGGVGALPGAAIGSFGGLIACVFVGGGAIAGGAKAVLDGLAMAMDGLNKAAQDLQNGQAANAAGAVREVRVAELTGGRVAGTAGKGDYWITRPGVGKTDVDVIGPNGEYIAVGGPMKANKRSDFGSATSILKWCADRDGVVAKVYLEEGTPQDVIDLAAKHVGIENVHIFK